MKKQPLLLLLMQPPGQNLSPHVGRPKPPDNQLIFIFDNPLASIYPRFTKLIKIDGADTSAGVFHGSLPFP
jgi:hypothetical protein